MTAPGIPMLLQGQEILEWRSFGGRGMPTLRGHQHGGSELRDFLQA